MIDLKAPDLEIKGPKGELDVVGADMNMEGPEGKFKMPHVKIPKFGFSLPKFHGPDVESDVSLPRGRFDVDVPDVNVDMKSPDIDLNLKGPDVNVGLPEAEGKGFKVKMPKIDMSVPKFSAPDIDLDFKSPKIKGDMDVSLPKMKGDVKAPNFDVDLEAPDVSLEGPEGRFKMPKFKLPKVGLSGPKVQSSDIDFELPKAGFDVTAPQIKTDIKVPDVDIKAPEIDFNIPDVDVKAPDLKMKTPKIDLNAPDLGVEGPKGSFDVEGPDMKIEGPEGKFVMPHVKIPKFGFSLPRFHGPDIEGDASLKRGDVPDVNVDVKAPDIDMKLKGKDVKVDLPDAEGKGFKVKLPSFNISSPKFSSPDVDLKLKGPKIKGDVDVSLPKMEGDLKGPDFDVDLAAPNVSFDQPEGKFKMPNFKIPKVGLTGPKIIAPDINFELPKAEVDVSTPQIKADMKVPDVDIKIPEVDIQVPDVDVKASDLKIKAPNIDLKAPDLAIGGPKGGLDVEGPDMDIEGPDGKFVMPHVKIPKFGFSLPRFHGPNMEGDASLKRGHVDVHVPDVNVDVTAPDIDMKLKGKDVNLGLPEAEGKGFRLKMPSFNKTGPKFSAPDVDLDFKGPKIKGDVDVSLPKMEGDLKAPDFDFDVEAPDVGFELPEAKFKMPKFKMPKVGLTGPKIISPDIDFELPKAEVDVTTPLIISDIKAPDVNVKIPDVDVKPPDLNIKAPKIDLKTPDLAIEGPKGGLDVEGPRMDIEGPEGRFVMPHVKIPKFGFSFPKFHGPDMTSDASLPTGHVDVDVSDVNVDLKAPDIDMKLKSPDVYVDLPEAEVKGFNLKMPEFNVSGPKFSTPDIDLKRPKIKGDVDISLPKMEGELKAPDFDIDLDTPDMSLEGTEGKFKMPKFKMPKVSLAGPKVQIPDINFEHPKAEVDVSTPQIKADIKVPDVDLKAPDLTMKGPNIDLKAPDLGFSGPKGGLDVEGPDMDIEGPEGRFVMPHVKIPKFGFSLPKFHGPDMKSDVRLPTGHVDVPEVSADLKAPDIDMKLKGPDVEVDLSAAEGKGFKVKMPKFNVPGQKFSSPDIGFDFKGPKIKGDVDVSLPKMEGEVKAPDLDLNLQRPDVSLEGPEGKFKMPKFKMPKVGLSGPKVKTPDIDFVLPKPEVDMSTPEIKADIKAPHLDIKTPEAAGMEIKSSALDFKVPDIDIQAPNIDMNSSDLSIKGPKGEFEIEGPDARFDSPEGKIKMPHVKIPKFGFSLPRFHGAAVESDISLPKRNMDFDAPDVKVDLKAPDIDMKLKSPDVHVDLPETDGKEFKVKLPKFNVSSPKFYAPDVDLDFKGPKTKGEVDVSLLSMEGDVQTPGFDFDLPGTDASLEATDGKLKMPKFRMPKVGLSGPKFKDPSSDFELPNAELDISSPKLKADIGAPDIDIEAPDMHFKASDIDVKAPDMEFKSPKGDLDVNVESPEGKFKMPHVTIPKFGFSFPKFHSPDVDLDASLHKGPVDVDLPDSKMDMKAPEIDMKLKGSDVDVDLPEASGKGFKVKMPKFNLSGPKFSPPDVDLDFKGPKAKEDVDVLLSNVEGEGKVSDIDFEAPDASLEGPEMKFKMPKFKMPKVSLSGPKVKAADIDFELPKAEVDVSTPPIKADLKAPDVDIKQTKFSLPVDVNVQKAKLTEDIDISIPYIEGDIKSPEFDVALESPNVCLMDSEGKTKAPRFKLPKVSLTGPNIKAPEIDFDSSKTDIDVSTSQIRTHFKAPTVKVKSPEANITDNIDLERPRVHVEGPEGKFNMPDVTIPKFGFSLPRFHGRDVELDASLPEGHMEVAMPDLNVDVKASEIDTKMKDPDIDVDILETEGKGFKLTMPNFHVSAPDVELDVKRAKIKNVDVSLPKIEGGIESPKFEDFQTPEVHLATAEEKIKTPKFRLPRVRSSTPKVKSADFQKAELDVSGPKFDGDVKVPHLEIERPEVDVKASGGKIGFSSPDVKLEGPDGKFKMPHIKMPKIGFFASKPQHPSTELDVSFEKRDLNVDVPEVKVMNSDVSMKLKGADVDVELPEAEGKGVKLKMPSFNLSGPKISAPDVDLDFKAPKRKGDVDVSLPKVEGDVKVTDFNINVDLPDANLEGTDGKLKMPKLRMPEVSLSGPKVKDPDIDFDLARAKVDMSTPQIKAIIKTPDIDVQSPKFDVKGPESGFGITMPAFNLESPEEKMKMPHVPIPEFEVSSSNFHHSGLEVDMNMPKVSVDNVELPDAVAEVKCADIDVHLPDAEKKGLKLKLPKFSVIGPKISVPDVEGSITPPLHKEDVNVSGPKLEGGLNIADGGMESSAVKVEGSDLKIRIPKFRTPKVSFAGPKIKTPEVDVHLPSTELESSSYKGKSLTTSELQSQGDFEIKVPENDIKLPEGDIGIKLTGPTVDVKSGEGKIKKPKLKLPKVGFSGSTAHGPDVNLNARLPKGQAEDAAMGLDVDVQAVDVHTKVKPPDVEADLPKADGKGLKLRMPKFHLSGPKISAPKVDIEDVAVQKSKEDMDLPPSKIKAHVNVPELDIDLEGPSAKMKDAEENMRMLDFKMPKASASWPRTETSNFDLKGPTTDLNVPGIDVKRGEIKTPDINVDLKAPGAEIKLKSPEVDPNFGGEGKPFKLKMPKFHVSGPKITAPDINIHAKTPKQKGSVDIYLPKVEGDMSGPKSYVKVDGQDVHAKGPEGVTSMMTSQSIIERQVKMPDIHLSKGELDTSTQTKLDINLPKGEITMPTGTIRTESPEGHFKGTDGQTRIPKIIMPKFGFSEPHIHSPEVELDISPPRAHVDIDSHKVPHEVSTELKTVDSNVKSTKQPYKLKMPKFHVTGAKVLAPAVDDARKETAKGDVVLAAPRQEGTIDDPDFAFETFEDNVILKSPDAEAVSEKSVSSDTPSFKVIGGKLKLPKFKSDTKAKDSESPKHEYSADTQYGQVLHLEASCDAKQSDDGKMSKFKLPKVGFTPPKGTIDLHPATSHADNDGAPNVSPADRTRGIVYSGDTDDSVVISKARTELISDAGELHPHEATLSFSSGSQVETSTTGLTKTSGHHAAPPIQIGTPHTSDGMSTSQIQSKVSSTSGDTIVSTSAYKTSETRYQIQTSSYSVTSKSGQSPMHASSLEQMGFQFPSGVLMSSAEGTAGLNQEGTEHFKYKSPTSTYSSTTEHRSFVEHLGPRRVEAQSPVLTVSGGEVGGVDTLEGVKITRIQKSTEYSTTTQATSEEGQFVEVSRQLGFPTETRAAQSQTQEKKS